MSEDWFLSLAPHGWDEWDFTQSLGPTRAAAALTDHFNSFITEADIEKMFQNGINHLRFINSSTSQSGLLILTILWLV
jgi:glucan 1,3-beta-glucosidase